MNSKKKECDYNNKKTRSEINKKTTASNHLNKRKNSDFDKKKIAPKPNGLRTKSDQIDQELIYKETDKLFNDDITDPGWGLAPLVSENDGIDNRDDFFDARIDIGDGFQLTDMDKLALDKLADSKATEGSVGDTSHETKAEGKFVGDKANYVETGDDMKERSKTPAFEGMIRSFGNIGIDNDIDIVHKNMILCNSGKLDSDQLHTDDTESDQEWDILNKPSVWSTDIGCYKQKDVECTQCLVKTGEHAEDNDGDDDDDFSYETFPSDTDFTLFDNDTDEDLIGDREPESKEQKANKF